MILWQFTINLPVNISHDCWFYQKYYVKKWYLKMYSDYTLIMPEQNYISRSGAYDTKSLFNAKIIKLNWYAHDLSIPEVMKVISKWYYLPYIPKYQKCCTLEIIEER